MRPARLLGLPAPARRLALPAPARLLALACAVVAAASGSLAGRELQERPTGQGFSFRTSAALVNVTVTVTDANGRFVPGLRREDFVLLEDGQPLPISQFDSDRVPVSLGLALDTSGSMAGEKMVAAQAALRRFLVDLLDSQDETFLYRFDSHPDLIHSWTTDRASITRALGAIQARGGTAMYDTVAEAIPMTQAGTRKKKALVVISDGNDTDSRVHLPELRQMIRETEVLVYAIGIGNGHGGSSTHAPTAPAPSRPVGVPTPSPFPGRQPAATSPPPAPLQSAPGNRQVDGLNADALRQMTDDSGGRTEVITASRDLDPATAGIADELRKQYFIGYVSAAPKDGKWHTIEVQVRKGAYHVRARRGFIGG